jgi:hypothetical protein
MASIFSSEPDAIGLLKQDHRKVEDLFKQFEQSKDGDEKIELAQQICQELTIHALVEEREFYPALLDAFEEKDDELIEEAEVEHRSLKLLIEAIDGSTADDRLFDANVKVLKEYVQHHVREEENEIMPKARSAGVDLEAIGARIQKLKERMTSQMMDAAEGQRSRGGKARVRVAKPGGRGASKRGSRATGGRKTAARANGSGRGRNSASRGAGARGASKGARKSATARKSNGGSARGKSANGRGGSSRSTGARSGGGGRGGRKSTRGGRGASASR